MLVGVDLHPDWFIAGSDADCTRLPANFIRLPDGRILAHGRDPCFPGWPDTLQLDYSNPGLREAMLSELVSIAGRCDGVRCDMAMLLLPMAAGMIALATPGMRAVAFGNAASPQGVHLLAVAVATLAVGLLPYAAFFLFARSCYALEDSRMPATLALGAAVVAGVVMLAVAPHTSGAGRVAVLGLGNTLASLLAALVLGVVLRRRLGHRIVPLGAARSLVVSAVVGVGVWFAADALDPRGRIMSAVVVVALAAVGGGVYLVGLRLLGASIRLRPRLPGAGPRPVVGDA